MMSISEYLILSPSIMRIRRVSAEYHEYQDTHFRILRIKRVSVMTISHEYQTSIRLVSDEYHAYQMSIR